MTSKNPAPALTTIAAPKPRAGKGEPPKSATDTAASSKNTTSAANGKLVDLGFKVDNEFRRNFRVFCADLDMAQVDVFKEALGDYMKKKGWTKTGD